MPYTANKHIYIVAGEASGDQHAAKLVTEIKQLKPNIRFSGIGGKMMQSAGVDIISNLAQYGVVGIIEVLVHLRVIWRAFKMLKQKLKEQKPDLLILVDYPGFNLRLARYAKKQGIKILYYVSPQIWAWKQGRIKTIRNTVDLMAVTLPFEVDIYRQANVPVAFVGHPSVDTVKPSMSALQARKFFNLRADSIVIGILPGSRKNELKSLLPVMCATSKQLQQHYDNIEFILPVASSLTLDNIKKYLPENTPQIKIVQDHAYDVMNCSNVVIVASGTATLETALIGTPMVIIYKLSPITYMLVKWLIDVKHIGLCNIIAGKTIVPELIQREVNPDNIIVEMRKYLDQPEYTKKIKAQLTNIKQSLNAYPDNAELAELVLQMIED